MTALRLLLIEDNSTDATLFVDQVQNSMGNDVEVEWKTRLNDALAELEKGQQYDQIWLDPGLPDLAQGNVGKALATLKKYVPSGELRMLSSTVAPAIAKQAQQFNVEVLRKDSLTARDGEILQAIQEMMAKKTGSSATMRVEMARELARMEGAMIKLEGTLEKINYQVSDNLRRIEQNSAALDRLGTLSYELNSLKEALNRISPLEARVGDLEKQLKDARESQQLRLKKWDVLQALLIASITAFVTLGPQILPVFLDAVSSDPDPIESSAPTP